MLILLCTDIHLFQKILLLFALASKSFPDELTYSFLRSLLQLYQFLVDGSFEIKVNLSWRQVGQIDVVNF